MFFPEIVSMLSVFSEDLMMSKFASFDKSCTAVQLSKKINAVSLVLQPPEVCSMTQINIVSGITFVEK